MRVSFPIRTHWDREKMGAGKGCKNWTFFMDVINVWSLTIENNRGYVGRVNA